MSPDDRVRVRHMIEAIDAAQAFVENAISKRLANTLERLCRPEVAGKIPRGPAPSRRG
jgi:hypothetical protein